MPEAQWHILGAGAMGCLFAEALSTAHDKLTLILRDSATPGRLLVERNSETYEIAVAQSRASDCGPISHLLVTTKAYDAADAIFALREQLSADATVVLMCNGMGIAEEVESRQPGLNLYRGTTTAGAHRLGPRHIRYVAAGQTRVGQPGEIQQPGWFAHWPDCLPDCRWDASIDTALWQKLAVNAIINPLTALNRCPNGALAREPRLTSMVTALVKEVAAVCIAAGYIDIAEGLHDTVQEVIESTAQNRSSMLQDVEAGRKTEVEYITGHLVKSARALGVATPLNLELFEQVISLDP